jgi:hypothetical protein
MGQKEVLEDLRRKIKKIENRPHARAMFNGIKNFNPKELVQIQDHDPQMKPKMIWKNLQNNLCPKCAKDLTWSEDGRLIKCVLCDFKIGIDKFNQYSMDQNKNPFKY